MNGYSVSLFLHVVGALGFFMALGLEWTGLRQVRSAISPEQIRAWMGILKSTRKLGFASVLTTVVSGAYMMVTVWGGVPWLLMSQGSLFTVMVLTVAVTGPRMAAIGQALIKGYGPGSHTFKDLVNNPLLLISIQTRVAITLGVILLKIAKPDLGGSLLIIGLAIVLGLVSTLPLPHLRGASPISNKEYSHGK